MATITTGTMSPQVKFYFSEVLATSVPDYNYTQFALKKTLARGAKTITFSSYNALSAALVPLSSTGVTPPSSTLTRVDIHADIAYYGDWLEINDQVTMQVSDPVLNSVSLALGQGMRLTEDELTRDMLISSSSFINCTRGVNGDNPTELDRTDIDTVIATLRGADAKPFTRTIEGENKFGTAPVNNAYFGLGHTDIISTLGNVAGFTASSQYPNQMEVLPAEYGCVSQIRFLLSSIGSITPTSSLLGANVYNIPVFGQEAYAVIDQDGYSAEFLYHDPRLNGPLELNATAGYKMSYASCILRNEHVINLRCTL